jgi:hypothetical protein
VWGTYCNTIKIVNLTINGLWPRTRSAVVILTSNNQKNFNTDIYDISDEVVVLLSEFFNDRDITSIEKKKSSNAKFNML